MIVAVASQNFRTVTQHAGKTRRFILFEADPTGTPSEIGRIDLPTGMAIHDFGESGPHPLDQANVIIAGSAGEGFVNRMTRRGIVTVLTDQLDPAEAVRQFALGYAVAPVGPCGCDHDHGHDCGEADHAEHGAP